MKKVELQEDWSESDFLFVATKPIIVDSRRNSFKYSKGYYMVKEVCKQSGIPEENFSLTKLTKRFPGKDEDWDDLYKEDTPKLINKIRKGDFKAVILLGKTTTKYLSDLDQDMTISKMRKRFYQSDKLDATIFPNYHPFSVMKKPGRFFNFVRTIEKLSRVDEFPTLEELEPKRLTIFTKKRALKAVEFLKKQDIISCDIETSGLNYKIDKIGELGMCWEPGTTAIFTEEVMEHQEVKDALTELFETESVDFLWQGGKFDIRFFKYQWDCEARVDEDTMLIHYLLNENFNHDLATLAQEYLNAENYEDEFKEEIPKDDNNDPMYLEADRGKLRDYLAKDADYVLRLYNYLKPLLEAQDGIYAYNEIVIPAANTLVNVEMNGITINKNQLKKLDIKLTGEVEDTLKEIKEIIWDLGYTPEKYAEGFGAAAIPDEYSPGSYQQNRFLFHGTYLLPKYDGWTTNKDAMKHWLEGIETQDNAMLEKAVEEVKDTKKIEKFNSHNKDLLDKSDYEIKQYIKKMWYSSDRITNLIETSLKYRKKKKLLSTYVKGFSKALHPNGRVHTNYNVKGTKTGRLSSSNCNVQNFPGKKEIKSLITVPDDKVLLECDYSRIWFWL